MRQSSPALPLDLPHAVPAFGTMDEIAGFYLVGAPSDDQETFHRLIAWDVLHSLSVVVCNSLCEFCGMSGDWSHHRAELCTCNNYDGIVMMAILGQVEPLGVPGLRHCTKSSPPHTHCRRIAGGYVDSTRVGKPEQL